MRKRLTFLLPVVLLLSLATGCSRANYVARAEKHQKAGQFELAVDNYREALSRTSSADRKAQSDLQYRIGECLLALNRISEAFSAYSKATELNEENSQAHLRMGELLLQAGEVERAEHHASAIIKRAGNTADALALLGSAAAANGNTNVAREAFSRVLELDPKRTSVSIALADVLIREDDADSAREVLNKAAAQQAKSASPWLALGRVEEQEGRVPEAEQAYRRGVAVEDSPEVNFRLAQFLERSGRVEEAEKILTHIDSLRPHFAVASADYLMSAGQANKANELYARALANADASGRREPGMDRVAIVSRAIEASLHPLGVAFTGDKAAPARSYLEEQGTGLDDATANILAAEIALSENDLPQAAEAAERAMQIAPDSAAAHYIKGVVNARSSDDPAAINEWQTALEKDPTFVPARIVLAEARLHDKDAAAAKELIIPVVRQEPGNAAALRIFARSLIASGTYASALAIIGRIEAISPESAEPSLLRGELAEHQRDFASALLQFQKAVLMDGKSQEAIDGLTRVYGQAHVTRKMLENMERMGIAKPASATLLEITGRLFLDRKEYADAERCFTAALGVDKERNSSAQWLARVRAERGNLDSASSVALQDENLSPMLQGLTAEQQNDAPKAVEMYEVAVRSGDTTGVAANNLAWIYAQQGRNLDRALQYAQQARLYQPRSSAVLDTLGVVHLARREYTSAIRVLEEARNLAARESEGEELAAQIKQHLEQAYLSAGETRRAAMLGNRSPLTSR